MSKSNMINVRINIIIDQFFLRKCDRFFRQELKCSFILIHSKAVIEEAK